MSTGAYAQAEHGPREVSGLAERQLTLEARGAWRQCCPEVSFTKHFSHREGTARHREKQMAEPALYEFKEPIGSAGERVRGATIWTNHGALWGRNWAEVHSATGHPRIVKEGLGSAYSWSALATFWIQDHSLLPL